MIKRFLLKLTPLEPYFFGDENSIKFGDEITYYVSSLCVPSAMTIMGMLRYTLLEQAGYLKHGKYTAEEAERNNQLIGNSSFTPSNALEYGAIKNVSPLFIMNDNDIYIKLPLNHNFSENVYTPIKLSTEYKTSQGTIALPAKGEFSTKFTVTDSMYLNIENGVLCFDMFSDFIKNSKNKLQLSGGFIKKSFKILKKNFSFAVIVDLDENVLLYDSICYMGREKSAFAISVTEVPEFSLESKIKSGALKDLSGFSYALGDIILTNPPKYKSYSMVSVKNLRYLSTTIDNTGEITLNRGSVLHNVISAGSVFYGETILETLGNDKFGINKIITFGGK